MRVYHEPDTTIAIVPISLPASLTSPADCDIRDAVACALALERDLRRDLAQAERAGSCDAEILRADQLAAERRVDALLSRGRRAAA